MTDTDRSVDVTDGPLFVPLLKLSLPIVATQLLQVAYNLVDTFVVGQLGPGAVAALTFSLPFVLVMVSLGGGMTVAGTVLVSQHRGAGNMDRVAGVAGQTLTVVTVLSGLLAVVGWVTAPALLPIIGTVPGTAIHSMAVEYTRTVFLGTVFMFAAFAFQAILRGWGDTTTPMYLMLGSVAFNAVLDPFFVLGFSENPLFSLLGLQWLESTLYAATGFTGIGVQGAALSTVISRGVGAIIGLWFLFGGHVGFIISPGDFVPDRDTVAKILDVGAPAGLERSAGSLAYTAMTALVGLIGADAVAAYGIGNRINTLVYFPVVGLAQGVETAVGQNLGAGQPARARRVVVLSAGIVTVVFALASVGAYVFAADIVDAFLRDSDASTRVVRLGTEYFQIIGPTYVFLGLFHVINGGFRGAGSTRTALVFSTLSQWGLRIPPTFLFITVFGMGALGAWWGIAISHVAAALVVAIWYVIGDWDSAILEDDADPSGPVPGDD